MNIQVYKILTQDIKFNFCNIKSISYFNQNIEICFKYFFIKILNNIQNQLSVQLIPNFIEKVILITDSNAKFIFTKFQTIKFSQKYIKNNL